MEGCHPRVEPEPAEEQVPHADGHFRPAPPGHSEERDQAWPHLDGGERRAIGARAVGDGLGQHRAVVGNQDRSRLSAVDQHGFDGPLSHGYFFHLQQHFNFLSLPEVRVLPEGDYTPYDYQH